MNANTPTLILIAVSILLVLLRDLGSLALAQLPADKRAQLTKIVDDVVRATEQAMPGANGAAKKQQAEQMIRLLASQAHLGLSPELLDTLIEASVQALNLAQAAATVAAAAAV